MIDDQRKPKAADTFRNTDSGDELLFYDSASDRVHVLNETAREIFLLCDGRRTERQVAAAIAERYGIESETAERDTAATLTRLYELGLLSG